MAKYVVNKGCDKLGKQFWYCHLDGFSYIPVFGSIGSKEKAKKIAKIMNETKK